jgi:hypothetical protein
MFLDKSSAGQMGLCRGLDFVVLQATDRTVYFKHSQSHIVIEPIVPFGQLELLGQAVWRLSLRDSDGF